MIRSATLQDARGIATVHVKSWQSSYADIIPAEVLQSLSIAKRTERWQGILEQDVQRQGRTFVAIEDGIVVGFADFGLARQHNESSACDAGQDNQLELATHYEAELYAIYLLEAYQGRGIGRDLLQAGKAWLEQQEWTSLLVWVLAENPAQHFYSSLGGEKVAEKMIEVGGKALLEYAYGWQDMRSLGADFT